LQPYLRFCDGPGYLVLQTRYCYTRFERKRMTDSQGQYRLYGVLGQVPLVPDATCVWNAKGHKCVSFQGSPSLRSIKRASRVPSRGQTARLALVELCNGNRVSPLTLCVLLCRGSFLECECAFPKLVFPTVSVHSRNKGDPVTVRISLDPLLCEALW
jgi:hypothetical protein